MKLLRRASARGALLMTVILSSAFTACTDTSDNPVSPTPQPPAELAEYAVLFYGHGSMSPSLDFDILKNIYDCYTAEAASYDKVKVAVQYKWGKKGKCTTFLEPCVSAR